MIGVSQLRRVPRTSWSTTRAGDVMVTPPTLPTLAPEDELLRAVERLRRTGLDGLPVMRGTELLGVLTRRGVVQAIQSRMRGARAWRSCRDGDGHRSPAVGRGGGRARARRRRAGRPACRRNRVPTAGGSGRVLAEPVRAATSLPPWDNSAMDGYAVVAADTTGASEEAPARLAVTGDVAAGLGGRRRMRPSGRVSRRGSRRVRRCRPAPTPSCRSS